MIVRLALAVAMAFSVQAFQPLPVQAGCGWTSAYTPREYIRVLRVNTGRVSLVRFRSYVKVVMTSEWRGQPYELMKAGAVAVKQYAWHRAMHPRVTASGACYHVKDSTADQLYRPGRYDITTKIRQAVDATWGTTVWRNGNFRLTGYRRGDLWACARDADGKRLYARSARRCADAGWSHARILRSYYASGLRIL